MAPLRIDVRSIDRQTRALAAQLRRVGPDVTNAAVDATAEAIADTAKRRNYGFRDRTGRLRRSIRVVRRGQGLRGAEVRAGGVGGVDYAAPVEYISGGRWSYLRRAVRQVRRNAALVRRRANAALRRLTRR